MKRVSRESGFTLIELMVAMVLLAIILLGMAQFHISTIQINQTRNNRRIALTLAQEKIEDFYSLSSFDDDLKPLADAGAPETIVNAAQLNNYENFQRISTWNYVLEDDFDTITGSSDAIRIDVSVSSTSASLINQFSPVSLRATRTGWE